MPLEVLSSPVCLSTAPAHWVSVPPEVLSSRFDRVDSPCTGDFSEPELLLVPGVRTPAEEPPRVDSEVVP